MFSVDPLQSIRPQKSLRVIKDIFCGHKGKKNNQGGFLLVGAIFLMLFLGLIIMSTFINSDMQFESARMRIPAQQAFYIAEAGIEYSINQLRQDILFNPEDADRQQTVLGMQNEEDEEEDREVKGTFTLTLTPTLDDEAEEVINDTGLRTVKISSLGTEVENNIPRTVTVIVNVIDPARFFVSTPGELGVASGATIGSSIFGGDVVFNIDDPSQNIIIGGKVQFMNNITATSTDISTISVDDQDFRQDECEKPFDLNQCIESQHGVERQQNVSYPGLDLPRYEALAAIVGESHKGDLTITSFDDDLGGEEGLLYVDGNVTISGEFENTLTIVATKDIIIEGNIGPSEDSLKIGLFASGDVRIPASVSDLNIKSTFIWADGGVFKAEGGQRPADSSLIFDGVIAVRGQEGQSGVDLNVFQNRTYTYDTEIRNSGIFYSNIVSLSSWMEQ